MSQNADERADPMQWPMCCVVKHEIREKKLYDSSTTNTTCILYTLYILVFFTMSMRISFSKYIRHGLRGTNEDVEVRWGAWLPCCAGGLFELKSGWEFRNSGFWFGGLRVSQVTQCSIINENPLFLISLTKTSNLIESPKQIIKHPINTSLSIQKFLQKQLNNFAHNFLNELPFQTFQFIIYYCHAKYSSNRHQFGERAIAAYATVWPAPWMLLTIDITMRVNGSFQWEKRSVFLLW